MIPANVYKSFVETGTAWAEANFLHQQLDDQTKSVLATIVMEAKEVEGVGSMAEATQIALASSLYRDHLKEVAKTKRDALVAKVAYDAVQALFQAQRTVEATHRAAAGSAT
jgi:hypothetical protein